MRLNSRNFLLPKKIQLDKLDKSIILKNIYLINISLGLYLTGTTGINTTQSTINKEGSLGLISTGIYFGLFGLANIVSPQLLIRLISYKWTLTLGHALQLFYIAFKAYLNWYAYIFASIVGGFGAGLVWSCSSFGISQLSHIYDQLDPKRTKSSQSLFFGIMATFIQLGDFFANFLTAFILRPTTHDSNSTISFNYSSCGANYNAESTELPGSSVPNQTNVYILIATFALFSLLSVITSSLQNNIDFTGFKETNFKTFLVQQLIDYKKQLLNINQLLLIPLAFQPAFILSFLWGDFTAAYSACAGSIKYVGWSLMLSTATSALFSPLFGKLASKTNIQFVLSIYYVFVLSTFTYSIYWYAALPNLVYPIYLLSILFGLIESINTPQPQALYGLVFNQSTIAFSLFSFFQGSGFLIGFLLSSFLIVKTKIYLILSLCCLCILCDFIRYFVKRNKTINP